MAEAASIKRKKGYYYCEVCLNNPHRCGTGGGAKLYRRKLQIADVDLRWPPGSLFEKVIPLCDKHNKKYIPV